MVSKRTFRSKRGGIIFLGHKADRVLTHPKTGFIRDAVKLVLEVLNPVSAIPALFTSAGFWNNAY